MTNKEIKNLCIATQKRQTRDGYPDYNFIVTQTKKQVRIFWEYIADEPCWTIDKESLMVRNEHGEMMNEYFDYNDTLENTIESIVYYMVTRY